ncbi:MAG: Gfo/Idh/MocA family oxidoreductase [Candidatus Omnitrophica bacterium]|nr:Gfo/Idh/MocA family oxidoreductase [Candidatus Omnitrophota bacterium]MCA9417982.1 Gfo/Idh/MocA family oxidoreductase [Candidatus Omnitrophota bacterium]MCA9425429.1 Gfo/Idh/MocA family oxidoreductase [Candidatus Omnitrophota bacterium]MCA9436286.1 Gfo/Idh/MocA family oxidoreductase [Candidatus Omnitrophota bacterium]MCB9767066.1 Gfo/Idh/MocA family oxidoreductase [Candidatus Omnitrophota bacterium]
MSHQLKVGLIGVAGIARRHFPGWKESPHTELVALGDINPEILKVRGEEQGITQLYENPEDLINNPEIDIVDICTPNRLHTPLVIAALEAGKHVLCEKPLAATPEEIEQMIAARDKSGKMLMTAQHFRFSGEAEALKAEIDTGVLGEIYHARSWMLRRSWAPVTPGFLKKELSGGGPCIDIGVHILDLTLWMMGHPKPVSVSGVTQKKLAQQQGSFSSWFGTLPKEWDVEEFASAFIRFENGATLILEVSWLLHHNTTGEDMQMWLYGDKGGSVWPNNEILTNNNNTQQHLNTQLVRKHDVEAHARECMEFAEAIVTGMPSPVPAEESLDVIRILDGLYRSAETGKEVRLDS